MPTLIRPFRGVQDNLEDPDEYIEDLEWAYNQDFQSAEPTNNIEAKQMYTNKTYRILFHNNLEGRAVECEVDVGMAIIQGMSDENEKKRISFECHKDSDFTFVKVKKLIRAAFFEVGKTSLFDSSYPTHSSSASPPTSDEALRQMVISASTSLPSILQGMRSIGTALQNLNRVPLPPQPAAQGGGVQRAYKSNRDLSDIRCFTCGQMGHYASSHREPDAQQPWASGALFPKDDSGPEVEVQGKLVTMVEEDDEDVMLAAPITLHDSGVKKRQPKKAAKPVVNQRQLRAIYEDPQGHESLEDTSEDMDEEEDLPAGPIREGNPRLFQETSANPRLPQTRTTKTGRVQELVVPKIPKKADSIRAMTGTERFDIKKIFDLPLEVTVREFLDRSNSTILPAQIYPMEVKLPGVEYDEELDTDVWSADDA
ncbi:hypothetical protein MMC31_006417, partial [Peltigera leucophlebia]|nr:hypothetical protein [Peltigera leucophlebia]